MYNTPNRVLSRMKLHSSLCIQACRSVAYTLIGCVLDVDNNYVPSAKTKMVYWPSLGTHSASLYSRHCASDSWYVNA